jgi:hypothetical protein
LGGSAEGEAKNGSFSDPPAGGDFSGGSSRYEVGFFQKCSMMLNASSRWINEVKEYYSREATSKLVNNKL